MKAARAMALLAALALAALCLAAWLRGKNPEPSVPRAGIPAGQPPEPPREQIFDVRGQIISLDEHSGIVKIAHEEIPNYMPAMTMPFLVRDSNSLRNLKPGDAVHFKLAVSSDDSWISEINKSAGGSGSSPAAAAESNDHQLRAGEKVPLAGFVDQDGRQRNLADFSGKFVVLTFIYTRCPLPNFCPLLNRKFAELSERLEKEFPGKYHLLSFTIDPAYDTPQVLKGYAANYAVDSSTWTFATGTAEQIGAIAELFGLSYDQKTPGLIDHDMRTALIAPDGRVVHIWKSNFWTPYEIRNRIDDELKRGDVALRN